MKKTIIFPLMVGVLATLAMSACGGNPGGGGGGGGEGGGGDPVTRAQAVTLLNSIYTAASAETFVLPSKYRLTENVYANSTLVSGTADYSSEDHYIHTDSDMGANLFIKSWIYNQSGKTTQAMDYNMDFESSAQITEVKQYSSSDDADYTAWKAIADRMNGGFKTLLAGVAKSMSSSISSGAEFITSETYTSTGAGNITVNIGAAQSQEGQTMTMMMRCYFDNNLLQSSDFLLTLNGVKYAEEAYTLTSGSCTLSYPPLNDGTWTNAGA